MHSGLADEAGSVPPTESWLGLLTSRVWFALRNMRIRWGSGGFPDTRSGAGSSPWPRWSPWAREDDDATVTRSGWAGSCARPGEPRFRPEPVLRFCAPWPGLVGHAEPRRACAGARRWPDCPSFETIRGDASVGPGRRHRRACLLYTSDAADDLTRVDHGGRRIIKKKKNNTT